MMYMVVWRKRGLKANCGVYVGHKDTNDTKRILDFLNENNEKFELVSITPCED